MTAPRSNTGAACGEPFGLSRPAGTAASFSSSSNGGTTPLRRTSRTWMLTSATTAIGSRRMW